MTIWCKKCNKVIYGKQCSTCEHEEQSYTKEQNSLIDNIKKVFVQKQQTESNKLLNATEIGKHFDKSANEINKTLLDLKWVTKKDRWIVATDTGRENGAKEHYHYKSGLKYVTWEKKILINEKFLEALVLPKSNIV